MLNLCINYTGLDFDKSKIFSINNIGLNLTDFLDELLNVHVDKNDMNFWIPTSIHSDDICLVHGDLNSSNVLLDENRHVAAIIDFGFGGFGNKYNDIGRIIGRCPTPFKNEIVNSYEQYSNSKLDSKLLDTNINTWTDIDNSYINYMRTIGNLQINTLESDLSNMKGRFYIPDYILRSWTIGSHSRGCYNNFAFF